MDKADVFLKELVYIENDNIRNEVINLIRQLPDYFFEVAASSTGKYHPEYSLGEGGLIRHTKALIHIAKYLLDLEYNRNKFTQEEQDCIIAAGILHDSFKHGDIKSQFSVSNHPMIAADHILEWAEQESEKKFAKIISDMVRCHSGEWNGIK